MISLFSLLSFLSLDLTYSIFDKIISRNSEDESHDNDGEKIEEKKADIKTTS